MGFRRGGPYRRGYGIGRPFIGPRIGVPFVGPGYGFGRYMLGDYLLFGAANSMMRYKIRAAEMARIEAYYNRKAEMISEAEMLQAMTQLGIQRAQLNAQEQAHINQMAMQQQATANVAPQPMAPMPPQTNMPAPTGNAHFCSNCGAPVNPGSKFCKKCGTPL